MLTIISVKKWHHHQSLKISKATAMDQFCKQFFSNITGWYDFWKMNFSWLWTSWNVYLLHVCNIKCFTFFLLFFTLQNAMPSWHTIKNKWKDSGFNFLPLEFFFSSETGSKVMMLILQNYSYYHGSNIQCHRQRISCFHCSL